MLSRALARLYYVNGLSAASSLRHPGSRICRLAALFQLTSAFTTPAPVFCTAHRSACSSPWCHHRQQLPYGRSTLPTSRNAYAALILSAAWSHPPYYSQSLIASDNDTHGRGRGACVSHATRARRAAARAAFLASGEAGGLLWTSCRHYTSVPSRLHHFSPGRGAPEIANSWLLMCLRVRS